VRPSQGGCPDPHQPLAPGGLPEEGPQAREQPLLVLWGAAGHGPLDEPQVEVLAPTLPGVGHVVENGEDEEERRATRLDSWIVWEVEERVAEVSG